MENQEGFEDINKMYSSYVRVPSTRILKFV